MTQEGAVRTVGELKARGESLHRDPLLRRLTRGRGAAPDHYPTRGLAKFVDTLEGRETPVVVDLGPAIGVNVTFLGDHLGCKLHVEDLLANLTVWGPVAPGDDEDDEAKAKASREAARVLPRVDQSVDGILCWDVLDYLDSDATRQLGLEVVRVLKPGGAVFVCHSAEKCLVPRPIQFEIVDGLTLRYRRGERDLPAPRVWQSRAVAQMFPGLTIENSFLLTNRMREVVLRKPLAPVD